MKVRTTSESDDRKEWEFIINPIVDVRSNGNSRSAAMASMAARGCCAQGKPSRENRAEPEMIGVDQCWSR
jgi:hypothetical protein